MRSQARQPKVSTRPAEGAGFAAARRRSTQGSGRTLRALARRGAGNDADWNENLVQRLRALWAEGHSTAEIGRRLGVSKNAVVGKAHRLQLPRRPSPIQRGGADTPRTAAPRRTRGPSLPPLPARSCRQSLPAGQVWGRCGGEHRPTPAAPAAVPPKLGDTPCCLPLGEPGRPGFRFCEARAVQGKPYCPEHDGVAYVHPRASRPDPVLGGGLDPYA